MLKTSIASETLGKQGMSPLVALFSLHGRTALVTGGTSGIGEMIARGLLLAGANVFISGRDRTTAEAKAKDLSVHGTCGAMSVDVTSIEGRRSLAEEVNDRAGRLDILVNNAGMTEHNSFSDYTEKQWQDVFALNMESVFFLTQAFRPLLKATASSDRPAHVLNVGSAAGISTVTLDSFAYGASKAAVHHLSRVLARTLSPDRIHVNAIAPGLFPSRMSAWIQDDPVLMKRMEQAIPAGRFGAPDDIAALVVAIVSNRYMTGTVIALDGGSSL